MPDHEPPPETSEPHDMRDGKNAPSATDSTSSVPRESLAFSVVVPALNNLDGLRTTLASILEQRHPHVEVVVVDGGSTDGSVEFLRSMSDARVRWISENDHGVYSAFNKGIRLARNPWILFLGCGDFLWDTEVLARVEHVIRGTEVPALIAVGAVAIVDGDGEVREIRWRPWREADSAKPSRWSFDHQGVFHHRAFFDRHGLFDESYAICGDYEILLRELLAHPPLFLDDVIVSGFLLGGLSSRPANLRVILDEKRRALEAHGMPTAGVLSLRTHTKMVIHEQLTRVLGRGKTGTPRQRPSGPHDPSGT